MKELTVGRNDAQQRLDRFVAKNVPLLPAALLQKYIRLKRIKRNGKGAKRDDRLEVGDVIQLYVNDEFFDTPKEENAYLTVAVPKLDIVYEDENILLVDKKPGQAVHPHDGAEYGKTLIDHIQAYLYAKHEWKPREENSFTPALCNRIDRNTRGLVIAAKNARALTEMNDMIKERCLEKKYLAVVHGVPEPKSGELRSKLEKDEKTNKVSVGDKYGKEAVTRYKLLGTDTEKRLSLLEIELLTGRTHQIRAQFASVGHPLLGDGKYAVNKADRQMGYSYQALCSYSLTFFPDAEKYPSLGYLKGKNVKASVPDFLSLFPDHVKSRFQKPSI